MIRAFTGKYLLFEDESSKRHDRLVIIEILHRKMDSIQLIIMNETHLLLATRVESITEISGYHRYQPFNQGLSPFGVGGLSKAPTDSKIGMLEGIAERARFDYSNLAKNFGHGLLEIDNDYILLLDE